MAGAAEEVTRLGLVPTKSSIILQDLRTFQKLRDIRILVGDVPITERSDQEYSTLQEILEDLKLISGNGYEEQVWMEHIQKNPRFCHLATLEWAM